MSLHDPELDAAYRQFSLHLPKSGSLDTRDGQIILAILLALRAIDRLRRDIITLADRLSVGRR
jgi:hypothetical protein